MLLNIYFRGENGKIEIKGGYELDEQELKKLQGDFLKYCSGHKDYQGGCYKYKLGPSGDKILLIKFDEILYID